MKNFLKNFKEKECKNLFCKIIQRLLFHQITQIVIAIALILIGVIIFKTFPKGSFLNDIGNYIYGAGLLIIVLIIISFIIYAWIINPIITFAPIVYKWVSKTITNIFKNKK